MYCSIVMHGQLLFKKAFIPPPIEVGVFCQNYDKSGVVPTLTANQGEGGHNVCLIKTKNGIRKMTPHECFNAQGFPKTFKLPSDMSNSRLYKQAGNSVCVSVIQRIAENIAIAAQII